jgi:HAE1 family hydrophobic/amphiphilic exporter-1
LENEYSDIHLKFVVASDTSVFTLAAANAVIDDLIYAIILVALVMLLFLHSIRNAGIVMVAIPLSIITTFIAMNLFGFSLNLMTLMALSLVIGILVDDSIVVLENIYRHLEMGLDKRTAALEGRNEIGFTALSITLVDVVVFGPLSLVGGLIGNILREFAIVVIVSTLMSLFVSFTVTPLLASRFSRISNPNSKSIFGRFSRWFENQFENLKANYVSALKWSLRHRLIVGLIVIVMLVASFALVPLGLIGSAFIASGDRGEFVVTLETDRKNTLYQTNLIARQAEAIILNEPLVEKVFSTVGSSATMGASQTSDNIAQLTVNMVDKKKRDISVDDFAAMVKSKIQKIPGVKVNSIPTGLTGSAANLPIQIVVKSAEVNKAFQAAEQILAAIKKIPGISDADLSLDQGQPELRIIFDREKMASLGVTVADVGTTLYTAFSGDTDSKYREKGKEYDI